MRWQRSARFVIAVLAVAFAVGVAFTFRRRPPQRVETPVARTDPKALVENAGGESFRINREREEVRIEYEKLLAYADGATRMVAVKVTTEREDRVFRISAKEGQIGSDESTIELIGDVRVVASDGMVVTTERATYTEADGTARAAGIAEFTQGRMSGTGLGLSYDKNQDILTIFDQAVIHVAPDARGTGSLDVTSGALEFRRNERSIRFDRAVKATRPREIVESDTAVAHLTPDEERLEALELRGNSKITSTGGAAGGLQTLSGRDIDLKYRPEGDTIERAVITAEAVIQLNGEDGKPGCRIAADAVETSLAPDGMTPTALVARENVRLTLPAADDGTVRTVASRLLDGSGEEGRGLSRAHFENDVQFTERSRTVNRSARSAVLDASVTPGFGSIDEAEFTRNVRFADGDLTATAATARYNIGGGTLDLSGTEPGRPAPHIVNDQIVIDATRMTIALEGPVVNADGSVRSAMKPRDAGSQRQTDTGRDVKMPSMLKQDQPVNVTADALEYQGGTSRAVYRGSAQLWQGETVIKAPSIDINGRSGDLSADGPVMTVSVLSQDDANGKKERIRSTGTANALRYEDALRRLTYTGEAHMKGPQGDLTGERIELFLKPSGDELERVEAYDRVTLQAERRKTTGVRLTYFANEGRYVVTGTPVSIVDSCNQQTIGSALTFFRGTDRIIVDGTEQIRTQTLGKSNCPG